MLSRLRATLAMVATVATGAALAMLAAAAPALADPPFVGGAALGPDVGPTAFMAQRGISLSQATAMAQSRYEGRLVSAKTVTSGDRVVHEIRILGSDGRVRTVRIDAQTGAFL